MRVVCYSEKMSKPAAKARAMAGPFTSMGADPERGVCEGTLHSRLKERCRSRDVLKSTARIRFDAVSSCRIACAAMLVRVRVIDDFAWDGCAGHRSRARGRSDMRLCMQ